MRESATDRATSTVRTMNRFRLRACAASISSSHLADGLGLSTQILLELADALLC